MKTLNHLKDVAKGKTTLFKKRSSLWPSVRKRFIQQNPECAACGWTQNLEVHHIVPFNVNPALELDTTNFIVLCDKPGKDNCHIIVGHLGNYKKANPNVVQDAKLFKAKL